MLQKYKKKIILAYKLTTILCATSPSQRIGHAGTPPPSPRRIIPPTLCPLTTRAVKPYLLHDETIPFALQNHTFCKAKRMVSQTDKARFCNPM